MRDVLIVSSKWKKVWSKENCRFSYSHEYLWSYEVKKRKKKKKSKWKISGPHPRAENLVAYRNHISAHNKIHIGKRRFEEVWKLRKSWDNTNWQYYYKRLWKFEIYRWQLQKNNVYRDGRCSKTYMSKGMMVRRISGTETFSADLLINFKKIKILTCIISKNKEISIVSVTWKDNNLS